MAQISAVLSKFFNEYLSKTPKKLKAIDAYLFYVLLTGIIQFVYCIIVGTFPFNSFLSGFISTVSCFVLGGKFSLKMYKHAPTNNLYFSMSQTPSESRKQEPVLWHQSGKRFCWFHIRSLHFTFSCHELYWLICVIK